MSERLHFIDIFDEMMINIQALYDTTHQEEPYGIYGDKDEVVQVLKEKDENKVFKFKKYPLIILYRGLAEPRGGINQQFEFNASPLISIVTNSTRTLKTANRYENSVKPILFPLYDLLLNEISENPSFYQSNKDEIKHTVKVWDGNPNTSEGGILYRDYLDGIDIQFTDLFIFKSAICS